MEKFMRGLVEFLDWPSGSILGLFTLIMIGVAVHAYAVRIEIPTTVVSVYQFVVATFAGSKAVKTVWGKHISEPKPE